MQASVEMSQYVIPSRGQSPFVDVQLAQHATKRFPKRALSEIGALSAHQMAGATSIKNAALYHVSPDNHICSDGCPGINYHFAIDYDGVIYQTNDLTDIVYSSGKKKGYRLPSQANCFDRFGSQFNRYSISVVVRGNFDGPGYKGGSDPYPLQMRALAQFAEWATQEPKFHGGIPIELCNFLGHCHVNKNACPGFMIQSWIENDVWTGKFLEKPKTVVDILGDNPMAKLSLPPFVLGGMALRELAMESNIANDLNDLMLFLKLHPELNNETPERRVMAFLASRED